MNIRPFLTRVGVVLATTALAVSTTSSGAHAASSTFNDRLGDVTKDNSAQQIGDIDHIDIRSLKVNHTGNRVTGTFRVYDLAGSDEMMIGLRLFDNRGGTWFAIGSLTEGRGSRFINQRTNRTVRCGISTQKNTTQNTVTIHVPRSCLGSPQWVRYGGILVGDIGRGRYVDDARKSGSGTDTFTKVRVGNELVYA